MQSSIELDIRRPDSRPPTILIVDDEHRIRAALRRTLGREPYDVLATGDLERALSILEEGCVDLLVIDQRMPDMRGTDFLDRAVRRCVPPPAILLTAWPDAETDRAEATGSVRRVLLKPWSDEDLRRFVREFLEGDGTADDWDFGGEAG